MKNQSPLELCNQLTNQFFHHLDERRYADMLTMMSESASWLRQGRLLKGHEEILDALQLRSTTMRVRHVMSNGFLQNVTETRMDYVAYMIGYRYDDGQLRVPPMPIAGPLRFLLVDTRFVCSDNDTWLIEKTSVIPEFEFPASDQYERLVLDFAAKTHGAIA